MQQSNDKKISPWLLILIIAAVVSVGLVLFSVLSGNEQETAEPATETEQPAEETEQEADGEQSDEGSDSQPADQEADGSGQSAGEDATGAQGTDGDLRATGQDLVEDQREFLNDFTAAVGNCDDVAVERLMGLLESDIGPRAQAFIAAAESQGGLGDILDTTQELEDQLNAQIELHVTQCVAG